MNNLGSENSSVFWKRVTIPKGLPSILEIFAREAIRENPKDLVGFLSKLVDDLIAKRDQEEQKKVGGGGSEGDKNISSGSGKENKRKSDEENPLLENSQGKSYSQNKDNKSQEEIAASKIQAGFRGFQTRKSLKSFEKQKLEKQKGVNELSLTSNSLTTLLQEVSQEDEESKRLQQAEDEAISAVIKTPLSRIREESLEGSREDSLDGSLRIKTPEYEFPNGASIFDAGNHIALSIFPEELNNVILEEDEETAILEKDSCPQSNATDGNSNEEEESSRTDSIMPDEIKAEEILEPVIVQNLNEVINSQGVSFDDPTIGSLNKSTDDEETLLEPEAIQEEDIETLIESNSHESFNTANYISEVKIENGHEINETKENQETLKENTDSIFKEKENKIENLDSIIEIEYVSQISPHKINSPESLDDVIKSEAYENEEIPSRKEENESSNKKDQPVEENKSLEKLETTEDGENEDDTEAIVIEAKAEPEAILTEDGEHFVQKESQIEEKVSTEPSPQSNEEECVETLSSEPTDQLKELKTDSMDNKAIEPPTSDLENESLEKEGKDKNESKLGESSPILDKLLVASDKPTVESVTETDSTSQIQDIDENKTLEKKREVNSSISTETTIEDTKNQNTETIASPSLSLSNEEEPKEIKCPPDTFEDIQTLTTDNSIIIPVSNLLTESQNLSFANTDSLSSTTITTVHAADFDKNDDSSQDTSSLAETPTPIPKPRPRTPNPSELVSSVEEMEEPKRQRLEKAFATESNETNAELGSTEEPEPVLRRQKSSRPAIVPETRSAEETQQEPTVLRRQKSKPQSRAASSKYRSGFVMDDEVSMEEMEAQIEKDMLSQAATKIQAGFRGFKTRDSLRKSGVRFVDNVGKKLEEESLPIPITEAVVNITTTEPLAKINELPVSGASDSAFSAGESLSSIPELEQTSAPRNSRCVFKPSLGGLRSRSYPGSAEDDGPLNSDENKTQSDIELEYDPAYINNAATVIQATIRGYLVRKRNKNNKRHNQRNPPAEENYEEEEDDEFQNQPVFGGLIVNPADRDSLSPMSDIESDKAAVKIQAAFRGYKDRQKIRKTKKAAVTIQATVRGFLTRRRLAKSIRRKSMQRRRSSAKLMSQEIQKMQKVNDAATKIQAVYRGYQVRSKIKKNLNDE